MLCASCTIFFYIDTYYTYFLSYHVRMFILLQIRKTSLQELSTLTNAQGNIHPTSFVNDDFVFVPVRADGECFFTCLAVHTNLDLLNAGRNEFGLPEPEEVAMMERQMADAIRQHVVAILNENKNMLSEQAKSLPFLLDREVGKSYSSMDDRLTRMTMPGEFAGHLEFLAASFILSRQIHVYTKTAPGYEVYATFRNDCETPAITILYRPDTSTTDGHFDVICKPSTMHWLKSDSVKNVSASNGPTVSFSETFARWQLVEPVTRQPVALNHVELSNIEEKSEPKSDCVIGESAPLALLTSTQPEPKTLVEPTQVKRSVTKTKEKEPLPPQFRPRMDYKFPSTSGRSCQGE